MNRMPHPLIGRLAALALAAGLAGCTTTPPRPPAVTKPAAPAPHPPVAAPQAAVPAPPPAPPPPPPELAPEARWLNEWFGSTPVTVALDDQGLVRLSVPGAHSFAAGVATPKPALKAVLDRVAQSLGRKPNAKVLVTVPSGATGREAAVRSHLLAQGLAAWRISVLAGSNAATELVLSPGQAPVRQVDDDKLPPPPPPTPKPVKPAPPRAAASR